MDLESLESFLEVEKHKNFTKAAESMFCTQAAVSMRIKRLETALECGLFKRCGRRVELTREGENFPALCQTDGEYLEICVGTICCRPG